MTEPLITPEDLGDLIGDEIDPTDAQLPRALKMASALIRSEADETFGLTDETITVAGTDTSLILLPHTPVLEVTSVLVRALTEADYTETTDYTWDAQGRLLRTDGGTWGGSAASVQIEYSHGYAEVPEDIQAVCMSVAKRLVVYGIRFSDQQLADPAAGVSIAFTPLEARIVHGYRMVRVA